MVIRELLLAGLSNQGTKVKLSLSWVSLLINLKVENFHLNIYIFVIYVHAYRYAHSYASTHGEEKRAFHLMVLELQGVVLSNVGPCNLTQILCNSRKQSFQMNHVSRA